MAILRTLPELIAAFDHSSLLGLGNDDHTQYILVDGTRAFTGVVSGVTPTLGTHLTTKDYVDDSISIISHGDLNDLNQDDHLQYHTDARALLWLGTRSTSDLPEGTNFYYTEARVSSNVDVAANTVHRSQTDNPHNTTLTQVLTAETSTNATALEIEELTDGSETTLHEHAASGINYDNSLNNVSIGIDVQAALTALESRLYAEETETVDHGALTGLTDDDHLQYHTDARGDARYYTQTQLNSGQLDTRYYTETEVDSLLALQNEANEITFDPSTSTLISTNVQAAIDEAVGRLDTAESDIVTNSDHGNLSGLADDDHTQYILVDGTRAFTGVVSGVTPTLASHLATKGYVDGELSTFTTDHGSLGGLTDDDHLQYHTDARGDVRYYTKTQLDSGQLDTRYYTETEVDNLLALQDEASELVFDPSTSTLVSTNIQSAIEETVGRLDTAESNITTNSDHGNLSGLADDDHTQYILVDGTRAFTGVVSGVTPTLGTHLTTKDYVDGEISAAATDHGALIGLLDDDHTQYILVDGTRAFTGVVSGVTPTVSAHLATKGYVDSEISSVATDHGALTGLLDDDHTQYILVDGTRPFSGTVGGVTPTLGSHLATKDYVDGITQGVTWQEPVLDKDLTTSPVSPTTGDRYIIAGTGGDWSTFTINDVVEYNGATWENTTPTEGFALWIEDEDTQYNFNGTSWVRFGSTVNHSNLTNLSADDHTQYLLADGTRNLSGNLGVDVGITIDGRDVSVDGSTLDTLNTNFSGHIDGGVNKHDASEIDVEGTYSEAPSSPTDLETVLSEFNTAIANASSGGGGSGRRQVHDITGGAVPPNSGSVGNDLGFFQALKFDPTTNNDILFQFPVPDNCNTASPITIVFKYNMNATEANNVKLDLNYISANLGDDVDPVSVTGTLTDTFAPGTGSQTLKKHSAFQIPAVDIASVDNMISCKLERDAIDVTDTHTGNFELLSIEIEYTVV